jgi:hypothetical protein
LVSLVCGSTEPSRIRKVKDPSVIRIRNHRDDHVKAPVDLFRHLLPFGTLGTRHPRHRLKKYFAGQSMNILQVLLEACRISDMRESRLLPLDRTLEAPPRISKKGRQLGISESGRSAKAAL